MELNQKQINEYDRLGYLVCPGFLHPDQLEILFHTIVDVSEGNSLALHNKDRVEMEVSQPQGGTLIRRIYEPCTHYPVFRQLSESAVILECIASLLGPNIVFHYSKINMKPAMIGSAVEWHQDLAYYPLTNDSSVTLLIYLDPANKSNGCLQVLPARHKSPLLEHTRDGCFAGKITAPVEESQAIPLEGGAGTAIFCIV